MGSGSLRTSSQPYHPKKSKMAGKAQEPGKIDDREASKQHLRSLFY